MQQRRRCWRTCFSRGNIAEEQNGGGDAAGNRGSRGESEKICMSNTRKGEWVLGEGGGNRERCPVVYISLACNV